MLTAGVRLGPYEILGSLGAGGMGEVYRARDTRLGREVAIKVLPPAFAADPDRLHRFEQEARATAALNHPNILAVFDVGTHEGSPYLVEELLEGASLREHLRNGPLPCPKAVEIAVAIAHGLAAAHAKGIVHRDLKPDNVFLTTDGVVKILDFGLAKLAAAPEGTDLSVAPTASAPHAVLGTPSYMAPEQVRGQPVDARADIFALGCVLYEMLAGRRAFCGGTPADTMSAILSREPPSLTGPGGDVPPALQGILGQCLEKRAEDRFSSAHDVALALRTLSGAADTSSSRPDAATPRSARRRWLLLGAAAATLAAVVLGGKLLWRSAPERARTANGDHVRLAVLPFENLGVASDAYFAAGVTDEITSRLAGVRGLAVVSRASAVQYANTTKNARQIGNELGVGYLVTGTVRWGRGPGGAEQVRITPQLVRVSDDANVWAEAYDFAMNDIFRVQSEIARAVVDTLGFTLLEHEQGALEARPTEDLGAYQAFLRGRFLARQPHFTLSTWLTALDEFQHAVALDPRFALAWADLSQAHARLVYYRYDISPQRREAARQALERARASAPDLPEVHLAAGYVHLWVERDPAAALAEFEAADARRPNDAEVLQAEAELFRLRGDWQRALDTYRTAYRLSPRDPSSAVDVAETLWWLRRYPEADAVADESIALDSGQAWTHLAKVFNLWSWKGRAGLAEAREALEPVPKEHEWAVWSWFWQEAMEGRFAQALASLDIGEDSWIRLKIEAAPKTLYAGLVHSWLGETRRATAEFEEARRLLEAEIRKVPDDGRYHSSLGIVQAALGQRDDALREGARGVELLPLTADPVYGIPHVLALAHIDTLLGDDEHAVAQLALLLSRPGWITVPWLRADPRWRPLDSSPRFQALLATHGGSE